MLAQTRILAIFAALAAVLALSSCARQISPGVYEGGHVGSIAETKTGTVQSARVVIVQEDELLQENVLGGAVGGVVGGLAGSAFGKGWGKTASTAGGALAGATLGAMAQRTAQRQQAMEYIVRMDDGGMVTVVQGLQPQIPIGRRVYVQYGARGQSRILPAG